MKIYQKGLSTVEWLDGMAKEIRLARTFINDLDKFSTRMVLDIAGGNGKVSALDRCRFLDISVTSAVKCAATLDMAEARSQLATDMFEKAKARLSEVVSMAFGLKKYLEFTQ